VSALDAVLNAPVPGLDLGGLLGGLFGGGGGSPQITFTRPQMLLVNGIVGGIAPTQARILDEVGSLGEANSMLPDFVTASGSVGGTAGFTGEFTVDRFGHIYLGGGYYVGVLPGVSASGMIGIQYQLTNPGERGLQQFLSGPSRTVYGGIYGGGEYIWNSHGVAVATGIITPSLGYSKTWAVELW
jgi:hypothetical protein